jgi:hypothetical protein
MRKLTILVLLSLMLSLLSITMVNASESGACDLEVSLINQEPYPAAPGSYVKLVFQVAGVENPTCNGANIKFVPIYPFSLDSNQESLKVLTSGSTFISNYNNNWMVAYNVRVDKDAIEGESNVVIYYSDGNQDPTIKKEFIIDIEDTRTSFDAVIQDVSESEVSIAIANVGKYDANSVIVRIPEQDDFKTLKTNGQMVGNLESGDYTLASFELTRNKVKESLNKEVMSTEPTNLKFEIHYTDSIGERRIINMELPLMANYFVSSTEASSQIMPGAKGLAMRNATSESTPWWHYGLIVLAILLVGWVIRRKSPALANLFKRCKNKKAPKDSVPEWTKK